MADEVESAAYARTGAWHGHGVVVEDAMTTQEAFVKSGLDWPGGVEKRGLFTTTLPIDVNAKPESVVEVGHLPDQPGVRRDFLPSPLYVPDQMAVVRAMDNAILGVVGRGYQVIQNIKMFDFLDALTAGEDRTAKWESAGSLRGGRHVWALLSLIDSDIHVGRDDKLLPFLLITNAHDGTASCRVIPTVVRVVCKNTLEAAVAGEFRDLTVTIRHTGDVEHKIADAKLMLARAGEMFGAFEKVANELAAAEIDKAGFDELVDELFPMPKAEEGEDEPSKAQVTRVEKNRELLAAAVVEERKALPAPDMSHWLVLNGVTRFVDHAQKVQLRGRDTSEARFEHSLIKGSGTTLKGKAAAKLIEMARR